MSVAAPPMPRSVPVNPAPRIVRVAHSTRLQAQDLSDGERLYTIFLHLSPLLVAVLTSGAGLLFLPVPMIMWLVRKEGSVFIDDHGRECTNFIISFLLLNLILAISIVGILLLPVLWVVAFVAVIRAAIAASRNEFFRYPVTIRFIP